MKNIWPNVRINHKDHDFVGFLHLDTGHNFILDSSNFHSKKMVGFPEFLSELSGLCLIRFSSSYLADSDIEWANYTGTSYEMEGSTYVNLIFLDKIDADKFRLVFLT